MAAKGDAKASYFSERDTRDAVTGCCHDFAFALARHTGWPIACLWHDPVVDEFTLSTIPVQVHLFCIAPDGRVVDVQDACVLDEMLPRYAGLRSTTDRVATYADEATYVEAMMDVQETTAMMPREHGIIAASRVIRASLAFMALLLELQEAAPTPRM